MSPTGAPSRIEPYLLDETTAEIVDPVAALAAAASALGSRLHPRSAEVLADLVRVMNCYYSNLIEGHNTTPREIVRALEDQLDNARERRNLQLEARAHIRVQREIDRQHAAGALPEPASVEFIRGLHRAFYDGAPPEMLVIQGRERQVTMIPGEFRTLAEHEVEVGRHKRVPRISAESGYISHRNRMNCLRAIPLECDHGYNRLMLHRVTRSLYPWEEVLTCATSYGT